ncbi:YheC/YheD family endospore coat-associated protein [Alicyclobacillus dauci]|uniref:YheC/YheD family protein n=1 Tax=Alicyclobacillus dauci TaxID=1475485 RepID=A0ABY6Z045_9BACL|nr:YheC/YheD family protein [Alicyclobacillus dauci]WAH35330.1 YheC/YheD family protein [Alicyclobacillus dauci]
MNREMNAELCWIKQGERIDCVVRPIPRDITIGSMPMVARFRGDGLTVPIRTEAIRETVIYRCPTTLTVTDEEAMLGEVYAILAGEGHDGFTGARLNFRDIIETAKQERVFIYVIPTPHVSELGPWQGYVRLGYKRWQRIPCPKPEAVYNRIPTRALEHRQSATRARRTLQKLEIPVFNPAYFSKSRIYEIITENGLTSYLPETAGQLEQSTFLSILQRHGAVYLKPSGGSVGHGMLRVEASKGSCWLVHVLKHGRTTHHTCANLQEVWNTVNRERVPGRYVVQQAIPLLEYGGNPCDFRVLLQKQNNTWHMVGRGVRVSGDGTITTHVPNGGSIANADAVLVQAFGTAAGRVQSELEQFVVQAAEAIDSANDGELGEMSMDIGIDRKGHPWFFEANAKPMKFDEPDIRRKSLRGIIGQLRERARST